jgi:hypothetical protein
MRTARHLGCLFTTLTVGWTLASPALAEEAPTSASASPQPTDNSVTVVLHADTPRATIERRASVETYAGVPIKDIAIGGIATWTPECTAPCEMRLDPKYTYRVAGDGLVPSDSFVLPHEAGPIVMDAKMGSALGRWGGLGLSATGAGGMILGAAALAVTPILANDNVGSPAIRTGVLASGVAVTTLGALVFGTGLWLWTHNETTVHPNQMRGFVF